MDPQDAAWMKEFETFLKTDALPELSNDSERQEMSLWDTISMPKTPCSSPITSITGAIIDPWLPTTMDTNTSLPHFIPLEDDQFFMGLLSNPNLPQPQFNTSGLLDMPQLQDTTDNLSLPNPTCICPGIFQQPICSDLSLASSVQAVQQEIPDPNFEDAPSRKELYDQYVYLLA